MKFCISVTGIHRDPYMKETDKDISFAEETSDYEVILGIVKKYIKEPHSQIAICISKED